MRKWLDNYNGLIISADYSITFAWIQVFRFYGVFLLAIIGLVRYDYPSNQTHIRGKKMEKRECLRCGHTWIPRVENPKECPNCKSRTWTKRKEESAIRCPDCGDVLVREFHIGRSETLYCRKCEITFHVSGDSFGKIGGAK